MVIAGYCNEELAGPQGDGIADGVLAGPYSAIE